MFACGYKRTFGSRFRISPLPMPAYPPKADINGYGAGCPLMTQSGHCLVLGLRAFDLTLRRVRLPFGHKALGFGELSGVHLR